MTNLETKLRELVKKRSRYERNAYSALVLDFADELTAILDEQTCETCNGTGFYGDNGPGIMGNVEYQPCECGIENKVYIDLATQTGKSERAWGHLEAIWNALEMGYEWEYGGYLERHAIAKIRELQGKAEVK
jgi:hypothetical protein